MPAQNEAAAELRQELDALRGDYEKRINDVFSLAFEGGVDWASATQNGHGGTLGKLTIAPQVALGSEFFSRPVLCAFFTYALWSDGLEGEIGGADYATQSAGLSWGVQMESWW